MLRRTISFLLLITIFAGIIENSLEARTRYYYRSRGNSKAGKAVKGALLGGVLGAGLGAGIGAAAGNAGIGAGVGAAAGVTTGAAVGASRDNGYYNDEDVVYTTSNEAVVEEPYENDNDTYEYEYESTIKE